VRGAARRPAGGDPLLDEDVGYAERLATAGVDATLHRVPGVFHEFWWMAGRRAGPEG
jgi:acetyl esterase/lipase